MTNATQKVTTVRLLLSLFAMLALGLAVYRFWGGLGAVTNLHDSYPWGLWIGFDTMCGEALAAGGFVLAGAVYLLV